MSSFDNQIQCEEVYNAENEIDQGQMERDIAGESRRMKFQEWLRDNRPELCLHCDECYDAMVIPNEWLPERFRDNREDSDGGVSALDLFKETERNRKKIAEDLAKQLSEESKAVRIERYAKQAVFKGIVDRVPQSASEKLKGLPERWRFTKSDDLLVFDENEWLVYNAELRFVKAMDLEFDE